MATRLYLADAGTPDYTPPTKRGAWTTSSTTLERGLAAKGGAQTTDAGLTMGVNTAYTDHDFLIGRWVSDPIAAAVSISGTVTWIYILSYSSAASPAPTVNSKSHLLITTGDTDVVRGTLLNNRVGVDAYTGTATGYGDGAVAVTTVAASVGDRIVLEFGSRNNKTSSTLAATSAGTYGGTDATDRGEGDTTAGRPPWVEFSTDIVFGGGGPPLRRPVGRRSLGALIQL